MHYVRHLYIPLTYTLNNATTVFRPPPFFFFNDPATTEIYTPLYTLSLHDALPIWFRVGNERYAKESRTYGITTLTRRHVTVRGNRVTLCFRGKHNVQVRTTLVDDELASAMRDLLGVQKGGRVFRYRSEDGKLANLTSRHLNEYVKEHMG